MRRVAPLLALSGCLLTAEPPTSVSGTVGDGNFADIHPDALQVGVGYQRACALFDDDRARCAWDPSTVPSAAPTGFFSSIAVDDHACALDLDGVVSCWGFGTNGGMFEATPPNEPLSQVDPGVGNTCGVRASDGSVVCWGDDPNGEGSPPSGAFTHVSVGRDTSCGIRDDGTLACWGDDALTAPPSGAFVDVTVGFTSACAVRDDGTLTCWGEIDEDLVPDGTFATVTGNYFHFCALGEDAACFGDDAAGETTLPGGPHDALVAGWTATCGIADGTVDCWGDVDGIGY